MVRKYMKYRDAFLLRKMKVIWYYGEAVISEWEVGK